MLWTKGTYNSLTCHIQKFIMKHKTFSIYACACIWIYLFIKINNKNSGKSKRGLSYEWFHFAIRNI